MRAAANMLSVPLQLDLTTRSYNATKDIINPQQSFVLQPDLIIWRNKVDYFTSFLVKYTISSMSFSH